MGVGYVIKQDYQKFDTNLATNFISYRTENICCVNK